ncbi:MAG: hypothetical protein H6R01_801 [Burkholderiaceae bacterium]|nr:hypothetical protein [Burkholderiaceae bacterium]
MLRMSRKIVQAVLYEVLAIVLVSPVLGWVFEQSLDTSGALAIIISLIAVSWNYAFNTLFERWERRQPETGRSLKRRLAHAAGFEGGLALMTIPLLAWWLKLSLWHALLADAALLVFFFLYAIAFHWAFDRIFGLPESVARPR